MSGAQAGTLPTGGQIVGGIGSIGQAGNAMTVQQGSDKLAIDWQSFSIGKDNLVRFVQPGADAIALNRVLGQDVSVIQGALQANGKVFLVNPNGILFTPGAQVDVGGILASTLKISTQDFLSGNYRFSGDSNAAVVNQGSIRTADGGLVALIAARVINEGNISAPKGDVLLAAGSKVKLDLGGPVALEVEQGALDALIENGGAIRADAGNILLTARAAEQLAGTVINTTGLIEAKSLEVGQDGTVTLSAAGGGVNVAGTVDVSSSQAKGGKVVVTGTDIDVASGARVSATGATGGGEIYVGGGWQGKDPAIAQATNTRIAQGAVLDASATVNGNGGTVVAWSDIRNAGSVTQVDGTLQARGGAQGGDGGRIETSGASLGVSQAADASAANGKGGLWLLDPDEVTVASTGGAIGDATVSHGAINTALGGGTNVDIHAVNKIDWQEDFQATVAASGARLKLQVDNNVDVENLDTGIFLNGGIDARGAGNGKLDVVLDGNVRLGQGKDIGIHSNGGDVLFGAYVDSISPDKALAGKLRITAADGTVTFSDMVGGTNPLDALYVTTTTSGKTYINGAIVRTHNEQVYESPVELGTVQFVNPDFEDGTNGWTIVDGRFVTGTTKVDGWTSPTDTTYPSANNSNGNNGDNRGSATGSYSHEVVAGNTGQGDALKLTVSGNCGGSGSGSGYCVVRGPYVVSDSTIALAKGDSVTFDWTAQAGAGQDAYDVFGYLLNVKTGEAQIILNRTGDSATGGSPWGTATVTADKAGTYKFVFVSGTFDFTGGNVIGANLTIDNVAASGGPKGIQGSSITFGKGLNATDNNLTVKADEIDLNGPVVGSGKLAFETLTPTTHIEVGGARADGGDSTSDGKLKLANEDIAALGDGFQSVRIGDSTMKGNISIVEDSRFNDDLIINAGSGNIAINAGLTVKDVAGTGKDDGHNPVIVLESKGGNVTQNANGVLDAGGLVLLGDGATHDLDSADNRIGTIASDTGSVSYGVAPGQTLTVGTVATRTGDTYTGMVNERDTSLTADEIDIAATISTQHGGTLALKQKTPGLDIHLGGPDTEIVADGDPLRLSQADLDNVKDGFGKIAIGDGNTRNITVDANTGVTLKDDVALTAGGKFDLQGNLSLVDPQGKDEDDTIGNGLVLTVDARQGATQADGAVIRADELALRGDGEFALGRGAHEVSVIAADVSGLNFTSSAGLTVGTVDGTTGITSEEAVALRSGGALDIQQGITVTAGTGEGGTDTGTHHDGDRTNDTITLEAAGPVTQGVNGKLDAHGLALLGGDGIDYALDRANNRIDVIASDAGKVNFNNTGNSEVGTLAGKKADGTSYTVIGVDNSGDVSIKTDGDLLIGEQLASTGNVFLNVGGKTTQDAEGVIKANGLALSGGDYALNNGGNIVGDIASNAGKVSFTGSGDLKVGTLTETDGNGNVLRKVIGVNNTGDVSINTDGRLTIDEQLASSGNVFLNVGGKTTQDAEGVIKANGLALTGGDYALNKGGNIVGDIASNAGKVSFTGSGDLKVGTLTETDGSGNVVRTVTGVNNSGDVSIATNGNLSIGEQLATTGNVFLDVAGKTTQDVEGVIKANGLALTGGDYALNNGGNIVGDIASNAGKVSFANSGDLKVGTLTETDGYGNVVREITGVNNSGDVSIATNGNLSIGEQLTSIGNVFLNAGGKTTQDAEGVIKANGLALSGGDYALNNGGNIVGDIASNVGKVSFTGSGDLKVGTLTETDGNGNVVRTVTGVNNTGDVSINTAGSLTIDEQLASTGNVFLNVGGKTTQDSEGVIKANGLALTGGDYALNNGGNIVGDIASNAGKVSFANSGDLKVGTLTETDGNGDVVRKVIGVNNTGDVSINTAGSLTIDQQLASSGNVFLNVGGKTTQDAEGVIKANGLALTGGDYALNNGGNIVGDIASNAGKVSFTGSGDLKVGTLTETDGNGNVVRKVTGVNNSGDVSINTAGNLTIDEQLRSSGNVFLNVGGKTTQDAEGVIKANGLALTGGDYVLNNAGNIVGDIASNAGKVSFTGSGDLKVGTLTETDGNGNVAREVTGVNNTGDVSIATNGNLSIGEQLASTGNVFLDVGGKTTQDASKGGIRAAGLALKGGDFDLDDGSNLVGEIASRSRDLSFAGQGDLTIGTLTEYAVRDGAQIDQIVGIANTGKVRVTTPNGDIAVTQNVATTSNASDAIVLNAGAARAAGDATGGDVIVAAGRTIEAGAGGRAVIYTGSVAGSAGVADVVGSGSGKFRYNSSETESNFGRPLGATGTYAVYREQPKIVVSTNGQTTTQKIYDGKPVFDGGGMAGFDVSGLVNGDLKAMLGDPTYRTSGVAPGSYPIDISLLNELGYAVQNDPNNAMLTVRPSQTYDSAIETIGAVVSNGVWQGEAHGGLAGHRRDDDYAVKDWASFAVTGLNLVQADAQWQGGTPGAGGAAGAGGRAAIGGTGSASGDTVAADTGARDGEAAERRAGRPDCVAGQAGACAEYGPQPVFVVKGGVRLPE
nr:filamentous hemagglutinin N-terminal domain-containing protein [Cupriavidus gilardii]